jgi:hypothetical protein
MQPHKQAQLVGTHHPICDTGSKSGQFAKQLREMGVMQRCALRAVRDSLHPGSARMVRIIQIRQRHLYLVQHRRLQRLQPADLAFDPHERVITLIATQRTELGEGNLNKGRIN